MKRKAAVECEALLSENSRPGGSQTEPVPVPGQGNAEKRQRMRYGEPRVQSQAKKRRTHKQVTSEGTNKLVNEELLEEMGVNILSDNSNSCDTAPPPPLVLQNKDQNILPPNASGSASSPLDTSNLSICSYDGSSSYTAPPRATSLSHHTYALAVDTSIPDEYFRYSNTTRDRVVQVKEARDLFNLMSDEVVLSVFRWLHKGTLARCALVCKRWYRLSSDESLWRRLDLGLATVPPGVVGQVVSRGCGVLRLARATLQPGIFSSCTSGLPTFPTTSMETSRLQYLDLSMASMSPTCMDTLLSYCTILKNLSLEMCSVSDSASTAISYNPSLSVLHMGQVQGLTTLGISRILSSCTQLVELNLGWTSLSSPAVQAVCSLLQPTLRRLCLSGNRDTLLDTHVDLMLDNCPNLRELDVSDSTKLTAVSLNMMVDKLRYLESLSTSRCYGISPSSYLILSTCPTLLYLNVFGLLRDPAMVELRQRLKGIEINKFLFTSIARPTVGIKRTSIWNLRVRE
eukprot:GFUD01027182.1.p1 GENE.GFUD01027182.1~~GFUD01027182.1.p1  ORF type:complete len:514 (+),score=163.99 GFUD01027182.1:108-1649(+)